MCHECGTAHVLYAEWPSRIFVCSECSSIFRLTNVSKNDETTFTLIGTCRFKDDSH